MYPGSPIPEYAKFEDPLWTSRFLDLANAMVLMGGKPKLIARYTGLSQKAIAERYKRLTGQEAPAGRLQQTQPRHYAIPHNRGGLDWNLQAATFSSIYLKIEKAIDEPANRGWLLLTAYQAYFRLTDSLQQALPKLSRISLNNAYDLMTHLGYGHGRKSAPLRMKDCDDCGASYLVITELEFDHQSCPMCAIQKRFQMLVDNAEKICSTRQSKSDLIQLAAAS